MVAARDPLKEAGYNSLVAQYTSEEGPKHYPLTQQEAERLASYEIYAGPETIAQQVDRYSLKAKEYGGPERQQRFDNAIKDTGVDLSNNNPAAADLEKLAQAIDKFTDCALYTADGCSAISMGSRKISLNMSKRSETVAGGGAKGVLGRDAGTGQGAAQQ